MRINHRGPNVFVAEQLLDGLPREIILQSVLDISLSPSSLQIFLALGCITLIETSFPIDKLEWHSSLRRRNLASVMEFQSGFKVLRESYVKEIVLQRAQNINIAVIAHSLSHGVNVVTVLQ